MRDLSEIKVEFDIDYFKFLKKEKGFTCKNLAELTGIHLSTILNYSNGNRVPVAESLYKLAIVLDVTIEDLLKEV